jgi:hypothetical protein
MLYKKGHASRVALIIPPLVCNYSGHETDADQASVFGL